MYIFFFSPVGEQSEIFTNRNFLSHKTYILFAMSMPKFRLFYACGKSHDSTIFLLFNINRKIEHIFNKFQIRTKLYVTVFWKGIPWIGIRFKLHKVEAVVIARALRHRSACMSANMNIRYIFGDIMVHTCLKWPN